MEFANVSHTVKHQVDPGREADLSVLSQEEKRQLLASLKKLKKSMQDSGDAKMLTNRPPQRGV
jgi:hypothetical protein